MSVEAIQDFTPLAFLGRQLCYSAILFCITLFLSRLMGNRLPRLENESYSQKTFKIGGLKSILVDRSEAIRLFAQSK